MSYIIAFVRFDNKASEFPFNCFRTDLSAGDEVVVRTANGKLQNATVTSLQYLNWNCKGQVECRRNEAEVGHDGKITLPKGSPLQVGVATSDAFVNILISSGWIPLKPSHSTYKAVLAQVNAVKIAYILVRKNGLDIQVLPREDHSLERPYSRYQGSLQDGEIVRHYFAHTIFNLFNGVLRFAESFRNNELDLVRYFVPQGSSDKRTEQLKKRAEEIKRRSPGEAAGASEMLNVYDALSDGSGEDVYLSDGMWLSSGGVLSDKGR